MQDNILDNIIILIPSLNPDGALPNYVQSLLRAGFQKLLIVNDGSTVNTDYFEKLSSLEGCTVLNHTENRGKGCALKTGFSYIMEHYTPAEVAGVVTADADGQHSVHDTIEVAKCLSESGDFVLGTRDFTGADVPPKSSFGNRLTTAVFAAIYGKKISDTQTGLRGIPYSFLRDCLNCPGERFDYEIRMLITAVTNKLSIKELPIETIYYEGNRETHFHAVKDSVRIYKVILSQGIKYLVSSFSSFLVDISVFSLFTWLLTNIINPHAALFFATAGARILSSLFNYTINRKVVFKTGTSPQKSLFRYYSLCVFQALVSWILVTLIYAQLKQSATLIKIPVDTLLFFASYHIQRLWVFSKK